MQELHSNSEVVTKDSGRHRLCFAEQQTCKSSLSGESSHEPEIDQEAHSASPAAAAVPQLLSLLQPSLLTVVPHNDIDQRATDNSIQAHCRCPTKQHPDRNFHR